MRTGYRLALFVAGITVVLAIVLFIAEAVGPARDASKYGQIPVPGRDSVTLPGDDVIVFYGERRSGDATLDVPSNLRLSVRTASGQILLGSTPHPSDQFDDGEYVRRSLVELRVPEPGSYEAVSSSSVPGATGPVISFGSDSARDFGYVLFVLAGGLLLAAILAAASKLNGRLSG
jgi:hypothetical protein